jgi:hypothetical protein
VHGYVEASLETANDARNDWMENKDPNNPSWRLNGENIQRSRLRWDAYRWAASKILPKVYGEKVEHDVRTTKQVELPYDPETLTAEEREALQRVLLKQPSITEPGEE